MSEEEELYSSEFIIKIAQLLGFIASICFTIQYIPQCWLNYQRKSVVGFSTSGIIIKFVGASFLFVNTYVSGEVFSVVAYGLFNVTQHCIFLLQFTFYSNANNIIEASYYLGWLCFPLLPWLLAIYLPWTIPYTLSIKPICQLFSHIPQLIECYRVKSTKGLSMSTQHLNLIGGLAGCFMCYVIPPISSMTTMMYVNSLFQGGSIYLMAIYYDGFQHIISFSSTTSSNRSTILPK